MKLFSIASIAVLQISGVLSQQWGWGSPSGAVTWGQLGHIRVYAVGPDGNLDEWQFDGSGWTGPSYIGGKAVPGSTVSAVNDGDRLRVYYKAIDGYIRERVYERSTGWHEGSRFP